MKVLESACDGPDIDVSTPLVQLFSPAQVVSALSSNSVQCSPVKAVSALDSKCAECNDMTETCNEANQTSIGISDFEIETTDSQSLLVQLSPMQNSKELHGSQTCEPILLTASVGFVRQDTGDFHQVSEAEQGLLEESGVGNTES